MDEELPFGYTHRHKRSHAQMEGNEGSGPPPTWAYDRFERLADGHHAHHAHHARPADSFHDSPVPYAFYPLHHHLDDHAIPPFLHQYRSAPTHRAANADDRSQPLRGHNARRPADNRTQMPPTRPSAARRLVGDGLDDRRHLTSIDLFPLPNPVRYPGDGFDYRRPVAAVQQQDGASFDLTGDEEEEEEEEQEEEEEEEEDDDYDDDEEEEMDFEIFEASDVIDLGRSGDQGVIDLTADDSGYGDSQDDNTLSRREGNRQRQDPAHGDGSANNGGSRLPRGMDIIIDLDNGDEEWRASPPAGLSDEPAAEPSADTLAAPSSPEIEFISARRIFPPHRAPYHRPHRPSNRPPPTLNRSRSDGDEVEFIGANPLSEDEVRRRRNQELDNVLDLLGSMNGRFVHLRAQVDRFNATINRPGNRSRRGPPVPPPRRAHGHVHAGAFMAPRLDFDMVAFDLGLPGGRAAEPPPPTYDAPPPAPEGFTRSPEEKDVLVCPNCSNELCCGADDLKKQVWIVKSCGHVYCGECTANRSAKRSAKGKERPANTKAFKECQVEGCGKSVSNRKAMIQVFL